MPAQFLDQFGVLFGDRAVSVSTEGDTETGDLVQSAGHQRGLGVEAEAEAVDDSGGDFYDADNMASDQQRIHPARMVAECRKAMPRETIAIVDSGAHRAFASHYWDSYGPREFITASNLGPMGWGIGAGIGAKAARPDRPVVMFSGDGCFRMHGMEVQTSARFGLPVIYCLSNNCAWQPGIAGRSN